MLYYALKDFFLYTSMYKFFYRCTKVSLSYAKLESAMIKFLSKCCWCHPANQKLLAELLTEVILQHQTPTNNRGLQGISGFTRRLILQLLLEGEKILISVASDTPMKPSSITSNNLPAMPPHPAFPLGHYHRLLYTSTQSTVADILQQVSGIYSFSYFISCKRKKKTKCPTHCFWVWVSFDSIIIWDHPFEFLFFI